MTGRVTVTVDDDTFSAPTIAYILLLGAPNTYYRAKQTITVQVRHDDDGDARRGLWWGGLTRGVALAWSDGEGGYREPGAGSGELEASLGAVIPYASLRASERLGLWGAAGIRSGHDDAHPRGWDGDAGRPRLEHGRGGAAGRAAGATGGVRIDACARLRCAVGADGLGARRGGGVGLEPGGVGVRGDAAQAGAGGALGGVAGGRWQRRAESGGGGAPRRRGCRERRRGRAGRWRDLGGAPARPLARPCRSHPARPRVGRAPGARPLHHRRLRCAPRE